MTVRLFGKLPAHGDFVSRGVVPGERDALDRWLSGSLDAARSNFGASFDARYDTAPPWRYAGDDGTAGAVAPSQDAAGRRFPVFLAVTPLSPAAPVAAAGAIEALLYDAIVGRWDADTLVAAVAAIDCPAQDELATIFGQWWLADGHADARAIGPYPPDLVARMLAVEVPA